MKRLLAICSLVAASFAVGGSASTDAGLAYCYTRGDYQDSTGRYRGAWTQCGAGNTYTYVATRVRCSNGLTYQGNRIGPNWLDAYGNLATSAVICPTGSIALSWYIAYWY